MRFSNELYRIGIVLITAYFVYQIIYFALNVPECMPPDENFHISQIYKYSKFKSFFLPYETLNVYAGERSRAFFLYHYIFGLILRSNSVFHFPTLIFLRLINGCLGVAYFYIFFLLSRMILRSRLQVLMALLMHASLLMFTFLYGAVNNDNLVNLLSILSIYFVMKRCMFHDVISVWAAAGCILLGCLVKQTFLPLAVALAILLVWNIRNTFWDVLKAPFQSKHQRLIFKGLAVAVIILLSTNVFLHGKNLLQYGTIKPGAVDVYGKERAYHEHPVLKKYARLWKEARNEPGQRLLDPIRFAFVWTDLMIEKVVGIFAYSSFYPPSVVVGFYELLGLFAVGALIARYRELMNTELKLLLIPLLFHTLVLMFFINYRIYYKSGLLPRYTFIALQGRYIFPVIAPLIIIVVRGLLSFQKKRLRLFIAVIASLIIFFYSFPYYCIHPPADPLISNDVLQKQYIRALDLSQRFIHP